MELTLASFAGRLASVTITAPDGTAVVTRALTIGEEKAVVDAVPAPTPPLSKDPTKGSAAPRIPNEQDPDFVRAFDEWIDRVSVMKLLVGMGYKPEGGGAWDRAAPVEQRRAWLEAAHDEVTNAVDKGWLRSAVRAHAGLSLARAMEETGLGNSGPSAETGTT